jgi:type IV pilus assembly protein PilO
MALLPDNQRDQIKLVTGFAAVALAVAFYMYPYASREAQLETDLAHVETLESQNQLAAIEFKKGNLKELREDAAQLRSTLGVMRRLVPTSNEVPALLEEVSTAARRAGLDVGGVTPEPVITGEQFDTYRYTVTIIGGYHATGAFLANVGSLPRIVAPVNFALAGASAAKLASRTSIKTVNKTSLASTITLQTYVEKTQTPRTEPKNSERTS